MVIAESFGDADEPVDVLLQSLMSTEALMLDSPLRVKQEPTQQLYQQFEEAGVCVCARGLLRARMRGLGGAELGRRAGGLWVGGWAHVRLVARTDSGPHCMRGAAVSRLARSEG